MCACEFAAGPLACKPSRLSFGVQAGTLSGNPLAMVAGIKTLEILDRPGAYEGMTEKTKRLTEGLLQAGRDAGHEVTGGCISGEHIT